jgi:serine/threonine-protein kinase
MGRRLPNGGENEMGFCLTSIELKRLVAGTLGEEAKARAEEHLGKCGRCRAAYDTLKRSWEPEGKSEAKARAEPEAAAPAPPKPADPPRRKAPAKGKKKPSPEPVPEAPPAPAPEGPEAPAAEVGAVEAAPPDQPEAALPEEPVEAPPAEPPELVPGFEVLDRMESPVGVTLCEAVHKGTGRSVQLQLWQEGALASEDQRLRFRRDALVASRLRHPAILRIHEGGMAGSRPYLAVDPPHGPDLEAYLRARSPGVEERLHLFREICAAVSCAHRSGLLHGCLQCGRILVEEDGEPRVLGFAIGELRAPAAAPAEDLAYAAPEQVLGGPEVSDTRTDVYALGVVLYRLLTGELPHPPRGDQAEMISAVLEEEPRKPTAIRPEIAPELEAVTLRALAKEPEDRYPSVDALAEDIARYQRGEAVEALRDRGWYVFRKALRRLFLPARPS